MHRALLKATPRALAALLCAALVASCAVTRLQPPRLSVVDVAVLGGDLWQQRLKVRMHVQNPNDRVLPVRGIVYTLEVEGQPFASGESAASFTVPALGEAEFDMKVNTNLAATVMQLLGRGGGARDVAYHLTGKVSLAEGFLRSIPFEQRGAFRLQ